MYVVNLEMILAGELNLILSTNVKLKCTWLCDPLKKWVLEITGTALDWIYVGCLSTLSLSKILSRIYGTNVYVEHWWNTIGQEKQNCSEKISPSATLLKIWTNIYVVQQDKQCGLNEWVTHYLLIKTKLFILLDWIYITRWYTDPTVSRYGLNCDRIFVLTF